ncbi:transcriptional regulator [Staphylococcus equorum]|uniref:helix-turn-helix domain-containing protein n=1 Tax=Staphylococcus equorum TaxID=246432 RepID=UPI0008FB7DAD|nr:helix-turn-helix transcriptional regulator [Staphylococcus equorum]OIS52240.1 transcriptional regulator [Staphylococcus equorum]
MRNSEQIGKYIKQIRQQKQMSVTDLAKKVDINKSTLSRYENGSRKIPMEDIADFANALGVTPENIMFEQKEAKTNSFETIAAHLNGGLTEEEWQEILDYAEYVKSKRKK